MAEHSFDTVDSERLYRGKIFALRADEVRMPGGGTARREVVEHFGAVAVLAADDADRIAMVYQYRHPIGRRLWELPAGVLDVRGEAPQRAAARELLEEAGLTARDWSVLVDVVSAPGFSDESVRVFLATGLTAVDRPAGHDEEADLQLDWVPLDRAVDDVLAGRTVNSIAVAGILAWQVLRADGRPARPADAPWVDRPHRFIDGAPS